MLRGAAVAALAGASALLLAACGAGASASDRSDRSDIEKPLPFPHRLVWSDDFTGPAGSPPDPTRWQVVQQADASGEELQCYTNAPQNIELDGNGHLVITALRQQGNCADGWFRDFTSGRMTTQDKLSWKYGRIEISAAVPNGPGTWVSFWSEGDVPDPFGTWPRNGEIDVMETVGNEPDHLIGTVHYPDEDGKPTFSQVARNSPSGLSGFHTYAVVWDQHQFTWYLDNHPYGTVTRSQAEDHGDWVFDRPFFLILNLAIGGQLGGDVPDDAPFPQQLVVNWIHVFQ